MNIQPGPPSLKQYNSLPNFSTHYICLPLYVLLNILLTVHIFFGVTIYNVLIW